MPLPLMLRRLLDPSRTPLVRARRRLLGAAGALATLVGCSPVRVINWLVPNDGYTVASAAYGPDDRQHLDLYVPDGAAHAPTVLFVYGGSWRTGDRADYRFVGQALASRGIVCAIADYRLVPRVRYPAFVEDTAAATAWIHREIARYGGDPSKLFLMGHSAGAYNVAMVALDARWLAAQGRSTRIVRGWIGMAGPYDFLPLRTRELQETFEGPDTPRDTQPVEHVTHAAPPALLMVAGHDDYVDPAINTDRMARALDAAGVPVERKTYGDLTHETLIGALAAPLRRRLDASVLDDIDRWLAAHAA